jgi:phosphate starvation-inducible protein PhoH
MAVHNQRRLTRKEKRIQANDPNFKKGEEPTIKLNFNLKKIEPLTENQRLTFESYGRGKNLMLHGIAGTGKSFISLYLALNQILSSSDCMYKKIVIVRSVVPTRDMGFLPGNNKEKARVYEAPYYAIFTELFNRGDAYDYLKSKGLVEFISTSFIRGITLNDCIIIVDEIANMTLHELDSVITRVGKNCKIMFCGDFRQSDFTREHERNGLTEFMRIINKMKSFTFVDFTQADIVRSDMVKEYIIMKDKLNVVA